MLKRGGRPAKDGALAKRPAAKTTEIRFSARRSGSLRSGIRRRACRFYREAREVNKAMIYYHFKSKEALYEAILNEIAQKF